MDEQAATSTATVTSYTITPVSPCRSDETLLLVIRMFSLHRTCGGDCAQTKVRSSRANLKSDNGLEQQSILNAPGKAYSGHRRGGLPRLPDHPGAPSARRSAPAASGHFQGQSSALLDSPDESERRSYTDDR